MTEQLLSQIWKNGYFQKKDLKTIDQKGVHIINCGTLNLDEGPDFLPAKIKIDNILWVGNIEIDLKTSYWKKHKHHTSKNYKNVILRIVWEHDIQTINSTIPILELKDFVPKYLLTQIEYWLSNKELLPCQKHLAKIPKIIWSSWKERMLIERLEFKTKHINELLQKQNNHWEQTFFILLSQSFGLKVNSESFGLIAESIQVNIFGKIKKSLIQIEALLLGQANLLNENFNENYPQQLKKEYLFLKQKFKLKSPPIKVSFLRMRPYAFPTIRLAQLASLLFVSHHLFSKIIEAKSYKELRKLFQIEVSDYWIDHFRFDKKSKKSDKKMTEEFFIRICINTIYPLLFLYAQKKDLPDLRDKVIQFFSSTKAEENKITKLWSQRFIENKNAFDSQSLYHLYQEYCTQKKCLNCAIGNHILKDY